MYTVYVWVQIYNTWHITCFDKWCDNYRHWLLYQYTHYTELKCTTGMIYNSGCAGLWRNGSHSCVKVGSFWWGLTLVFNTIRKMGSFWWGLTLVFNTIRKMGSFCVIMRNNKWKRRPVRTLYNTSPVGLHNPWPRDLLGHDITEWPTTLYIRHWINTWKYCQTCNSLCVPWYMYTGTGEGVYRYSQVDHEYR